MNKLAVPIAKENTGYSKEKGLELLLLKRIAADIWEVGDRLPAERKLAAEFSVSRNTLRGALRRLETRGLIVSKQGSGHYVKSTYMINASDTAHNEESYERIMARFEAAYLFLPGVIAIAAINMTEEHLTKLEACTVNLSRAIFKKDIKEFKKSSGFFFQIIATSTKNQIIAEIVSSFCASSSLMFPDFFSFKEKQQNEQFADYVLIFNALKKQNVQESVLCVKKKIINTCVAFSELKNIQLPRTIKVARQELR